MQDRILGVSIGCVAGLFRRLLGSPSVPAEVASAPRVAILSGSATLEVVGESFYQDALWDLVGGVCSDYVRQDAVAVLEPEPTNPHDANAVRVLIDGRMVGYLSREDAAAYLGGLRGLLERARPGCVGLHGVICGGGQRGGRIGCLGVFLDHDPSDFGVLPHHHERMRGELRTGYSQARATDLADDRYDLSWDDTLAKDDAAASEQLRVLLEDERDPIDRHYMFAELERRVYRRRDEVGVLALYDGICQQHDAEMDGLRVALVEKFGVVPMIELYRQAAVRFQKSHDWTNALHWIERGITIYGDQAARLEDVADLEKRAAYATAKLGASAGR